LGGSHAQRDVFIRTLALSAANMGDTAAFARIMTVRHQYRKADRFAAMAQACRDAAIIRMGGYAHV
jgi:hypothetical protein